MATAPDLSLGVAEQHIPKWKKLGLKLKNATNGAGTSQNSVHAVESNEHAIHTARKREALDKGSPWPSERLAKRSRKSRESDELVLNGITQLNKHIAKYIPSNASDPELSSSQKRKSVSFAPEAKIEDGDSVSRFKYQLQSEQASVAEPSQSSKSKRKKDSRKAAADESRSRATPRSTSDTPHLEYLTLHHTSPERWKFSKRHQNHILKHLFDLEEVPSSFDSTLISYLSKLQGLDARARIRTQASEIRQADDEWLNATALDDPTDNTTSNTSDMDSNDPDRRRRRCDAYEAEVARVKRHLREKAYEREDLVWELGGEKEAWEAHCRKRKRAEFVLWSVGEIESESKVKVESPKLASQLDMQQRSRMEAMGHKQDKNGNSWMLGRDAARIHGNMGTATGKKIIFDDAGAAMKTEHAGHKTIGETSKTANGVHKTGSVERKQQNGVSQPTKKPRKRRQKRRTGVPDDDDTSSSSSGDDDRNNVVPKAQVLKHEASTRPVKREQTASDSGTSDSDDSSSSDD